MEDNVRLVISGTYSTGKTTTTVALSLATGIPFINALSAREILTTLYPGRRFQDMNSTELMALGLKRMEERIREEAILYQKGGSFISDGSILNEWIYGTVRMKVGINPGSSLIHRISKAALGIPAKGFFKKYLEAYGQVANLHARRWYTHVVHLPIEFEMVADGHRPVSEAYRIKSDVALKESFENIGILPLLINGDQVERVEKIIKILKLPQIMPAGKAVEEANLILSENREALAQRMIDQYREPSLVEKISILTKY